MENIKPVVWQITKSNGAIIYVKQSLIESMVKSEMPSATVCIDTVCRLYRVSEVVPLYSAV